MNHPLDCSDAHAVSLRFPVDWSLFLDTAVTFSLDAGVSCYWQDYLHSRDCSRFSFKTVHGFLFLGVQVNSFLPSSFAVPTVFAVDFASSHMAEEPSFSFEDVDIDDDFPASGKPHMSVAALLKNCLDSAPGEETYQEHLYEDNAMKRRQSSETAADRKTLFICCFVPPRWV